MSRELFPPAARRRRFFARRSGWALQARWRAAYNQKLDVPDRGQCAILGRGKATIPRREFMSPRLPEDAPTRPPDEVEAVAAQFLAQLRAGEKPDREAVVRAHPHLADRLGRRLALVEMIYRVGLAPEAGQPTVVGGASVSGSE